MSLKTWKAEFYPVHAYECPKEDALEHSIQKWRGLTLKNLAKHKVKREKDVISDGREDFAIDGSSCALCVHYTQRREDCLCTGCDLYESRGGVQCDAYVEGERDSPYGALFGPNNGSVGPMNRALAKAKRWKEKQPA